MASIVASTANMKKNKTTRKCKILLINKKGD